MFVTSISQNISFSENRNDYYLHTVSKYVYQFSSLEDLLAACRALNSGGVEEDGVAYADNEKRSRYFLELDDEAPNLCEFGASRFSERDGISCYLSEHCRPICLSAIRTLGALA